MTCSWAGCRRTDTTREDGWDLCALHAVESRALDSSSGERPDTRERVEQLHAAGLSDRAIATTCGVDRSTVRWHRKRLGLPLNGPGVVPREPCGTHAAFNRHRVRGEEPCDPCWTAERTYSRDRKRAKRGAA